VLLFGVQHLESRNSEDAQLNGNGKNTSIKCYIIVEQWLWFIQSRVSFETARYCERKSSDGTKAIEAKYYSLPICIKTICPVLMIKKPAKTSLY
jgi:hypothetical protein